MLAMALTENCINFLKCYTSYDRTVPRQMRSALRRAHSGSVFPACNCYSLAKTKLSFGLFPNSGSLRQQALKSKQRPMTSACLTDRVLKGITQLRSARPKPDDATTCRTTSQTRLHQRSPSNLGKLEHLRVLFATYRCRFVWKISISIQIVADYQEK